MLYKIIVFSHLTLLSGDGDDEVVATVSVGHVDVVGGEDARKARLDILRLGQIIGTAGHIRGEDHNILHTEKEAVCKLPCNKRPFGITFIVRL